MSEKIRVFISYSHKDFKFVEELEKFLENHCEVDVIWDNKLIAGYGFHEQIKDMISSSHIFMPLITEESTKRGWVHQEIGYAMGLNIPVLPVTMEDIPAGGMLQTLQAVKIDSNIQNLEFFFGKRTFESLLSKNISVPLFHCAHLPEERTRMMTEYCDKISNLNEYGMVRQKGGLSSFHIPADCLLKQAWKDRYYPESKSEFHKRLQRNERVSLENHASNAGYKLIITPHYAVENRHPVSSVSRISTLIEFLNKNTHPKAMIALHEEETETQSLTIVGNWFLAESVSFKNGDGFTNTFFTRNVSEITQRTEDFECELDELLSKQKIKPEESRVEAIKKLEKLKLDKELELERIQKNTI